MTKPTISARRNAYKRCAEHWNNVICKSVEQNKLCNTDCGRRIGMTVRRKEFVSQSAKFTPDEFRVIFEGTTALIVELTGKFREDMSIDMFSTSITYIMNADITTTATFRHMDGDTLSAFLKLCMGGKKTKGVKPVRLDTNRDFLAELGEADKNRLV